MNIIELLYYAGYLLKKRSSLKNQKRLPHRVISVGNITLGGTGKTPFTMALAHEALKRGHRPCILTRGYRGKIRHPSFVSRGDGPLLSCMDAGDEPVLMAQRLRDVEIIKGIDRYEAGLLSEKADLFILDDGFQHWRLHRDLDIVLIDGMKVFGNGRLFPLGPLREPLMELQRADIIVITRYVGGIRTFLERSEEGDIFRTLKAPLYAAHHEPSHLMDGSGKRHDLNILQGKKVFSFCGIGNPDDFHDLITSTGAEIRGTRRFRDHHFYTKTDVESIQKKASRYGADWIITTEKDIIKIRELGEFSGLLALSIDLSIEEGFFDKVFLEVSP